MSIDLFFCRKHTCGMLRRYLYASMQACRIGSSIGSPIGRGWVTSRPVHSFEDAIIFVCDMDKCIERLNSLDQAILQRVVIQEYTQPEAALLLGMSRRTISYKLPIAIDRLSEKLIEAGLLIVPESVKAA